MIIGTAGHIDHGKTRLVHALTGVDTDRLPEEKRRGITIELGYAYLPLATEGVMGFIDVPGHEKFIHTMLAGATGIDFGLIVVAADDGVMPQTREHIDILNLLGVDKAAIAITKCDRADTARIASVEQEVQALLTSTPLASAPVFSVSAMSGAGIDALREYLCKAHADHQREIGHEQFRLSIDRVFTLEGQGTIVTGTVFSGRIGTGDHVALTPQQGGKRRDDIRIRSIHAQNRRAEQGSKGERCALNLAGVGVEEISRGQWITGPDVALETERIDVSLRMLNTGKNALRGGAHVHLHVGAAHCLARVIPLDRDAFAAGEEGLAQLALNRPLGAWHGDRFVLRDAAATRTIAGGRILDPFAPARYRRTRDRLESLAAHAVRDAAESLDQLSRVTPWGVDLGRFARARSLSIPTVRQLPSNCLRLGGAAGEFGFDQGRLAGLKATLVSALDLHHSRRPEDAGMDLPRLKRIAMPKLPDAAMHTLVTTLLQEGACVQSGAWLARPGHADKLNHQDKLIAELALPLIAEGRFDPPWVRDISRHIGHPEAMTRGVLSRLARQGKVFAIVKDLYYDSRAIDELSRIALRLDENDHTVRAATFRDATGLGRKRAIQVLEFFDHIGFTRRLGDDHMVRNRSLFAASVPTQSSHPAA